MSCVDDDEDVVVEDDDEHEQWMRRVKASQICVRLNVRF